MRRTHSQMVGSFESSELERLDLVPLGVSNGLDGIVCIIFSSFVISNGKLR